MASMRGPGPAPRDTERRCYFTVIELWVIGVRIIAISKVSKLSSSTCPNPPIPCWEAKQDCVWLQRASQARMVSECSLSTKDSWSHPSPRRWQLDADLFLMKSEEEGGKSPEDDSRVRVGGGPWGWKHPPRKSCSGILNVSEERLCALCLSVSFTILKC